MKFQDLIDYIKQNDKVKVEEFLESPENNFDSNYIGEGGKTSLHYAAEAGAYKVIQTLIDHGAKVNIRDKNKSTPLLYASRTFKNKENLDNKDSDIEKTIVILLNNQAKITYKKNEICENLGTKWLKAQESFLDEYNDFAKRKLVEITNIFISNSDISFKTAGALILAIIDPTSLVKKRKLNNDTEKKVGNQSKNEDKDFPLKKAKLDFLPEVLIKTPITKDQKLLIIKGNERSKFSLTFNNEKEIPKDFSWFEVKGDNMPIDKVLVVNDIDFINLGQTNIEYEQ